MHNNYRMFLAVMLNKSSKSLDKIFWDNSCGYYFLHHLFVWIKPELSFSALWLIFWRYSKNDLGALFSVDTAGRRNEDYKYR